MKFRQLFLILFYEEINEYQEDGKRNLVRNIFRTWITIIKIPRGEYFHHFIFHLQNYEKNKPKLKKDRFF